MYKKDELKNLGNSLMASDDAIIKRLLSKAIEAKTKAYVKYSNFPIGVAILTRDGKITTGFNIEHSSYSLTLCGERVALARLLSEGYQGVDISKILIVGDVKQPISPCGACREFMSEFINNNVEIILAGKGERLIKTSINELLPHRFTEQFLEH